MNKFTIVIPTHNRNSVLFKTLNWIQRDVSNDTEVIVIDDCSDKPVNSSIISYFTNIKIKLIRMHKKSGASKCRNIGAQFASNEWIAFFDDDDYWLIGRNNYLSKLTENLTRKKLGTTNNAILSCPSEKKSTTSKITLFAPSTLVPWWLLLKTVLKYRKDEAKENVIA